MMKYLLVDGVALALLAWLAAASCARAQCPPAPKAPVVENAPESCPSCEPCKMVVTPTVERVPHTCICYDVKEEDYAYTHGVHSPILSRFCRDHCGICGCADEAAPCHDCGKARTRKVLIKEFVTESVPTPKCKVERVPVCAPCPAEPPSMGNVEDTIRHDQAEVAPGAPKKPQ